MGTLQYSMHELVHLLRSAGFHAAADESRRTQPCPSTSLAWRRLAQGDKADGSATRLIPLSACAVTVASVNYRPCRGRGSTGWPHEQPA